MIVLYIVDVIFIIGSIVFEIYVMKHVIKDYKNGYEGIFSTIFGFMFLIGMFGMSQYFMLSILFPEIFPVNKC